MYDGINITGNGFGFRQDVREGRSADDGSSSYTGKITLQKAPRWTSTTGSLAVLKPMTVR